MLENKEGSQNQLAFQKEAESAGRRRWQAFDITHFRLFLTRQQSQRYQFARLRDNVHRAMALQLTERRIGNVPVTPEEAELGFFPEEIEPQVREAVLIFNRKGYKTTSSGFEGDKGPKYNPEYQLIQGHFVIDAETAARLAAIGVTVTTEPSWKWQIKSPAGLTPRDAQPEERLLTTIRFKPPYADLQEIKAKWDGIAALLPHRK